MRDLDLDLQLEDLDLFLSWESPIANNASTPYPSMFFHLFSFDKKNETTSSKLKVFLLLPMDTTRLSHESGKEHNKLICISSSKILILKDNN